MTPQRLRVIAWGAGAVGSEIVTTILDHRPDIDIVGTRVYSPAKDAADVGTLVGRDPIGVTATTDTAKILALQADCVLYTPRHTSIDEVTATVEAIPAEQDHQIFDHLLRAGTTAGQRWTWTGRRAGKPLIEIAALWTVGGEYPGHWPTPEHGWTLTIEGDPSMRVHFFALASFTRAATTAEHVRSASVATAMQVLNAVPAVCAAPPGFATTASLPLIRSHNGFNNTSRDGR